MSDVLVICIGQSLANGYYGPGYVGAGTYGSGPGAIDPIILSKASTRKIWVETGFAYTLSETNPHKTKVDPWQNIRQNLGILNYRATTGYDAGIASKLVDLGHTPSLIKVTFGSTTSVEWTSPNGFMWLRMTRAIASAFASTHCPITTSTRCVVYMDLGQSDAADGSLSPNYGTWLTTFMSALRVYLSGTIGIVGTVKFIIVKTNNFAPGGDSTKLGQVQSGQASAVAGDGGNSVLLSTVYPVWDSPPLHDSLSGSISKGQDAGVIIAGWLP